MEKSQIDLARISLYAAYYALYEFDDDLEAEQGFVWQ